MSDAAVQHVDPAQVKQAAAALLKHLEQREAKREMPLLIEEDELISLIVTLKQIPTERKAKPISIPLAHPLSESHEICIFTKDPQEEHKAKLLEIPGVRKVIGLTKLRKNYKTFEAKRKLVASYDLFLTDDRIVTFLPSLLGKAFYERKRNPIPISFAKNIATQIRKVEASTFLFLNTGVCLNVKVARSIFTADQVTENVMTALAKISERVPKKWANIQSLHIKSSSSVSLPIYNSLPDAGVASRANVQTEKRKLSETATAPSKSSAASGTPKKARTSTAPDSEATATKPSAASGTPKKARTSTAAVATPSEPSAASGTPKKARPSTPAAAAPHSNSKPRVDTPRPTLKTSTPKRVAVTPK